MEIKQLTFTRFIAAFTIILFHYGQDCIPFDTGRFGHYAKEGAFAVSYFFCLSGYILTHVYFSDKTVLLNKKVFFIKRFVRIYPIYLIGFLFALITGVILFSAIPKGGSIILQLLGLHAWVPGIVMEINHPGWSISVELFFYLSFPFLLNYFSRLSNRSLVLFTLLVWIISGLSHVLLKMQGGNSMEMGEFILYNPLFHINAFIVGITACILYKRSKCNIGDIFSSLTFIISCLLLFLIIATDNPILPWIHNGLLAPLFIIIIIALQSNKGIIAKLFSLKPLVFLGEISYGMYILQHPVRLWFSEITKDSHLTATSSFYIFASILITCAAISYLSFEKPFRRWFIQRFA